MVKMIKLRDCDFFERDIIMTIDIMRTDCNRFNIIEFNKK